MSKFEALRSIIVLMSDSLSDLSSCKSSPDDAKDCPLEFSCCSSKITPFDKWSLEL